MPKKIPFNQVVSALLDNNAIFPPAYLHRFSDLEDTDLSMLKKAWPQIDPSRRRALLDDLEELSDTDTLTFFDDVAKLGLDDGEPGVRAAAIRMLWESGEVKLAPRFLTMLEKDPAPEVRAAAASTLGQYVYMGELEEIPEDVLRQVEDALLRVEKGQDDKLVRRRALEALGFSGRAEVPPLIQAAYDSLDPEWGASAIFAMGRSYDQAWAPIILRELISPDAKLQLEAVRAAGELTLDTARRKLFDLLEEEASDADIRGAAIWSLSQIGGEEVRETLERLLEDSEDDEDSGLLEEALDNLTLTEEGQNVMNLLDIDLADKEHYGRVVDLENQTDETDETENTEDDEEADDDESAPSKG
jgi:HEAT repeat protein